MKWNIIVIMLGESVNDVYCWAEYFKACYYSSSDFTVEITISLYFNFLIKMTEWKILFFFVDIFKWKMENEGIMNWYWIYSHPKIVFFSDWVFIINNCHNLILLTECQKLWKIFNDVYRCENSTIWFCGT